MAARPDMTVVIRTPGVLLRADVRGGEAPSTERWRQDWSDVASAVDHALGEGGKPGKRVWVLDSEVWLGVVDLPAGAVAGQSDKDLAGPAAYEAEALSDLSPIEAITAVQRRRMVDQGDQFLVTQARRTDVTALAKVVRQAGAKLAGLGHPAGLPAALDMGDSAGGAQDADRAGWRRLEFWAQAVVLTESVGGRLGLVPLGVGPRSDWRRSLAPLLRGRAPVAADQTLIGPGVQVRGGTQWRESTAGEGTARWLAAGEDPGDEDDGVPTWDLADEASATQFAQAWAGRLAAMDPAGGAMTPTLRPPKPQAARWPAAVVGVLALALTVYAVVSLRDQATQRIAELDGQLAEAQQVQDALGERRKLADQAKADVRTKQRAITGLESQQAKLIRQRQAAVQSAIVQVDRREALSAVMTALTRASSDATMIQSIDHGSPRHDITGMAASPEAATRLARDVSRQLRGFWVVSPPQIEPETETVQVAWRFTITIEPVAGLELQP
ncbi:MAG: hypothetical protein AAGI68_00195 [Planctomycetota bacterium]